MSVSFVTSQRGRTLLSSPEAEQRVVDLLLSHYQATYPREAVGVVMGDGSVLRFTNWSLRPDRFRTLGLPLLRWGWKAWRRGHGVAYIYHSHRKSTRPSESDVQFMRVLKGRWSHVDHLIFTPDGEYDIWSLV